MQVMIAIFPSKETQDYANTYRKRYDPSYKWIDPHLVVRQPQDFSEEQLKQAIAHLQQTTSTMTPFTIRLNRFSSSFPSRPSIYMAAEDHTLFEQCYRRVCQGVLSEDSRPVVQAQLVVGQQLAEDEGYDVLASLRKTPLNESVHIDRLSLLCQSGDGTWVVKHTFLFGQDHPPEESTS